MDAVVYLLHLIQQLATLLAMHPVTLRPAIPALHPVPTPATPTAHLLERCH